MHTQARKLHIIEAVLKTENEQVLQAIERIVSDADNDGQKNQKFADSLGLLSVEEAEAMKQVIQENFEKVNPDDWK